MNILTPAERRALRAKAHHLHPVVAVGQHGLTPAVLHEIDVALLAHELVKIRVFSDERAEREALLERICADLGAAAVQHLGKILIVWRPAPPAAPEPAPERRPKAKAAAGSRRTPRGTGAGAAARSPAGTSRARSPAAGAKPPPRAPRARSDRSAPRDAVAGAPAPRRRPAGRGTAAQPLAGVPSSPARRRRRSH